MYIESVQFDRNYKKESVICIKCENKFQRMKKKKWSTNIGNPSFAKIKILYIDSNSAYIKNFISIMN